MRTRLILTGAIVATTVMAAVSTWGRLQSERLPHLVATGVWIVPLLALVVIGVFFAGWPVARPRRRWSFDVVAGSFDAPLSIALALADCYVLVLCGLVTSTFLPDVLNFERLDPPERALAVFGATVTALLIFFVVARVVYYWRGVVLRLTPRGLLHRAPLFSRFIPWEALVPGTPEPPPSRAWQASTIQLAVSLPNLVELRGMQRVAGDPRRPLVLAQTLVDATLLAWAIRWYAEHPEHRAGIGTPVEHDRLVAALPPPH